MDTTAPPTDTTLTPLMREPGFLAAVIVGAPALIVAYALGWHLALDAFHNDLTVSGAGGAITALVALLAGNPITLYLAARQYPRGKAVEARSAQAVAVTNAGATVEAAKVVAS